MKLTLNPYTLIIKDEGRLLFILSDTDNPIITAIDDEKLLTLQQMHERAFIDQTELCGIFGEQTVKALSMTGSFLPASVDTESMLSRTNAFFMSHNMPNARAALMNKKVLILGCGGIGTHMAWHMTALGIAKITLVDFDTVEKSNFNRQLLFDNTDIGKDKASVLKDKLAAVNPDIEIETVNKRIGTEKDLEDICTSDKFDLIIKALDTPTEFPVWLDNVAQRNKLTYVSGITMRENVLIGPSYVPDVSKRGMSELLNLKKTEASEKLYGTSPSLGIMLYNISDELAIEAFKLLTGYGKPKYIDTILCRNVFTDESHYIGENHNPEITVGVDTNGITKKELVLNIAVMIALTVAGLFEGCFLPVAFAAAIALPLYIYKSRIDAVRCAFINASVYSIGVLVALIRTVDISTPLALISSAAILFGIHSALTLLVCATTYFIKGLIIWHQNKKKQKSADS